MLHYENLYWFFKSALCDNDINRIIKLAKKQNKKLEDVLLSLRNEYINQGGDPNQLEIFDVNHGTQLKIFESPDGGKTIYEREAGDYDNMRKKISD